MLRSLILISLILASCLANTLEQDAQTFMNRRRLQDDDTYSPINATCTDNNYNCNILDKDGVCQFYQYFGNSCISSYMVFGFGVVVFILIPFSCMGCYIMNDVSTPLRVPTRILPVRKEY